MRKPRLRVLALAVATALVGLTALPGSSYASAASAPNPRSFELPFGQLDDPLRPGHGTYGVEPHQNLQVGDCVMGVHSVDVRVEIDYTTNELVWRARAWTTHTNSADIWHSTFSFLDSAGQVLATVRAPDGPRMPQINKVYAWERVISFPNRPNPWDVAWVRWHAAC